MSPALTDWLAVVVDRGGSDLYLVAGLPPTIRVDGRLDRLEGESLDGGTIEQLILPALAPHAQAGYRQAGHTDAAIRDGDGRRFRVNSPSRARPRRGHDPGSAVTPAVSRRAEPPAPGRVPGGPRARSRARGRGHRVGQDDHPGRAGRSDQPAGRQDTSSRSRTPSNTSIPHHGSVVEQVEIGVDAPDFPTALRSAVRQSPDVIVVGEMRDPETMQIALAAGETGHLVFSTLHTSDVAATISRVADSFPLERQSTVRQELSMSLVGGHDPGPAAPGRWGTGAGSRAPDGRVRRAPAHPQECASASASGDHDDPRAWVADVRRVPGSGWSRRADWSPTRRGDARCTPTSSTSCCERHDTRSSRSQASGRATGRHVAVDDVSFDVQSPARSSA